MRVGFNGMFWGMEATGSGQYVRQLLQALVRVQPSLAGILYTPPQAQVAETDLGAAWSVCRLTTPFDRLSANLSKLWFEQVAFPMACRRARVDLAHVPYFAPPLSPGVPTLVTIHDLIPLILPEYRGSLRVRGYMQLVSAAARRAALVLTDSRASARDIERLLGIPRERIRVLYLAADARFCPLSPAERQPVLERLRIPPRYLLYLGGFDQRKNVAGLLRAYARARPSLGDVALVIAGKLPEADSAFAPDPRPLAARLGLADAVRYTGWVAEEDKPALYAGALAFVFPSLYEGFGLPVLEAISCGAPVVVAGGSSLEEVAGPGGWVVRAGDEAALGEALVALAQSPALRQELAAKVLQHAKGFSWERTARQTLAAYREVAERAGHEK